MDTATQPDLRDPAQARIALAEALGIDPKTPMPPATIASLAKMRNVDLRLYTAMPACANALSLNFWHASDYRPTEAEPAPASEAAPVPVVGVDVGVDTTVVHALQYPDGHLVITQIETVAGTPPEGSPAENPDAPTWSEDPPGDPVCNIPPTPAPGEDTDKEIDYAGALADWMSQQTIPAQLWAKGIIKALSSAGRFENPPVREFPALLAALADVLPPDHPGLVRLRLPWILAHGGPVAADLAAYILSLPEEKHLRGWAAACAAVVLRTPDGVAVSLPDPTRQMLPAEGEAILRRLADLLHDSILADFADDIAEQGAFPDDDEDNDEDAEGDEDDVEDGMNPDHVPDDDGIDPDDAEADAAESEPPATVISPLVAWLHTLPPQQANWLAEVELNARAGRDLPAPPVSILPAEAADLLQRLAEYAPRPDVAIRLRLPWPAACQAVPVPVAQALLEIPDPAARAWAARAWAACLPLTKITAVTPYDYRHILPTVPPLPPLPPQVSETSARAALIALAAALDCPALAEALVFVMPPPAPEPAPPPPAPLPDDLARDLAGFSEVAADEIGGLKNPTMTYTYDRLLAQYLSGHEDPTSLRVGETGTVYEVPAPRTAEAVAYAYVRRLDKERAFAEHLFAYLFRDGRYAGEAASSRVRKEIDMRLTGLWQQMTGLPATQANVSRWRQEQKRDAAKLAYQQWRARIATAEEIAAANGWPPPATDRAELARRMDAWSIAEFELRNPAQPFTRPGKKHRGA